MKAYVSPNIEIYPLSQDDVISTSVGTETSKYDECDGIWDLELSNN